MKNSNALEKSKGVVLFASNTETVDYVKIAKQASRLIEYYLGLPVTILDAKSTKPNQRYSIDSNKFETWNNSGRSRAYELSPYNTTILLDSDYLVLDDNLKKIIDTTTDYKIVRHNEFIDIGNTNTMGTYSLPFLWATVVVFEKSNKSKMLFDLVSRIERNYSYYRKLYNIRESNFRNDYAFTIADNILNGYTQDQSNYISWTMKSLGSAPISIKLQGNQIHVKNKDHAYVLPKQSLHVISKFWLLSEECEEFIKAAIDERI